jgi:hypothetical protein
MIGYSISQIFTLTELELSRDVTSAVIGLPEDEHLRCHELARSIAIHFADHPLKPYVVDGKFGLVDHSWIQFGAGPKERGHILDVYAVGASPMVQLIDAWSLGLRSARQFVAGVTREDIRQDVVDQLLIALKTRKNAPVSSPL